jgi:hypothetical protein
MSTRTQRVMIVMAVSSILLSACNFTLPAIQTDVTPSATFTPWTAGLPKDPIPTSTPTPFDYAGCEERLKWMLAEQEVNIYFHDNLRDVYQLVTYSVSGSRLVDPEYSFAPESLTTHQDDTARHEQIWQLSYSLLPEDQLGLVDYFLIYTDGEGDSLGAVQLVDTPRAWLLAIDIEDAQEPASLFLTIVHELGHLLTLNDSQVILDMDVFENPEDEKLYQQAQGECSTYFTYEGCAKPDSYLNTFFQHFWPEIYPEWQEVNESTTWSIYVNGLEDLYERYSDQFVSEYAVTNPMEDIAESFLHFVFTPKPNGPTVASQKTLFFYNYSELVNIRTNMLQTLCTQLP